MNYEEIEKIRKRIGLLPPGGITHKTINGSRYAYYQWREDGKQRSRIVKGDELELLSAQIEERKGLQAILSQKNVKSTTGDKYQYHTAVRIGDSLDRFVHPTGKWKKRSCFMQLSRYVYGDMTDRVFILYGLRRTGKTTMIRQLILEMDEHMRSQTAFIQVGKKTTLADINQDLRYLESKGYCYIFIDEVTFLSDFIEGAALFSDIFASSGMKIVLSGTDSLGFVFSEDEQLYDRCIFLHTTFIPYREFEQVLGIRGIDEYIRYGGTMSLGGIQYNEKHMTFATKESTDEYVDSAIARNIQHSLANYQQEGHFRSLWELYDKNELTNAINRVVEDINHRFTIEVLTRDFKSNDLGILANNLRRDRSNPNDILDRIDMEAVRNSLKELLEIRDRNEQKVKIKDAHKVEIKEYLNLLDLTVDIDVVNMSDLNHKGARTVFSQPGMRYAQAEALIASLLQDEKFSKMSIAERNRVTQRILAEIKGRMMEDIVLLETKLAKPACSVFVLQFPVGEFDMVVFDPESVTCQLYEIKYSRDAVASQGRHLTDEEKCVATEFRFGTIVGKYVIYRGETKKAHDVQYLDVEEYLKGLS